MLIENSKKKQPTKPEIHVHVHLDKDVKDSTKSESKKNNGKQLLKG